MNLGLYGRYSFHLFIENLLYGKFNGAADKPRRAGKPQAFSPEVGLIRVVVRRFAPRKQRMPSAAPLSRARS
ncbi:MAG: hypothetical protein WAW42_08980, partial [Candidatus Competibacteraceae bacterium]